MSTKHSIFAFVGASGSGKSTIMIELLNHFPHLSVIKSTSTRTKRDEMDEVFYKFVDEQYANSDAGFLTHEIFAGNHYIYEQVELDSVLRSRCGMFAIIEPTVPKLRDMGYDLKLIKVVPERDFEIEREKMRKTADDTRSANSNLEFDLVIMNSFAPGGLEKSIRTVAQYINDTISAHIND